MVKRIGVIATMTMQGIHEAAGLKCMPIDNKETLRNNIAGNKKEC